MVKHKTKIIPLVFCIIASTCSVYAQDTLEYTDLYGDYLGQSPPGDIPAVFAPGIVSTIYMEHSALAFSPDGIEVFCCVHKGFVSAPDIADPWISGRTMQRIGDRWTVPSNSSYGGGPVFSPDGKRLYFTFLLPNTDADGPYFVEKHGDTWSEPRNLDLVKHIPVVKSVHSPSISSNSTLYFSCDTSGIGRIKDHIIYRSKLVNGAYSTAELLPRNINLPGSWNYSPFIAPDESYLLFASNRPGSLDSYGNLYISLHDMKEDTWSDPLNLGEPINTPGQESSPGLSPDGRYLFYTSPVAGRQADVFWVSTKVIDRLKEKHAKTQKKQCQIIINPK